MGWKRRIPLILIMLPVLTLVAIILFYKPLRIVVPTWFGLTCPSSVICIDDLARLDEATAIRAEAETFVTTRVGPFETPPRVLFCSTADCFARFGNPDVRGLNLGTYGMIVGPTGWDNYIVRHEMIHHWQNEALGVHAASVGLPRWYIEGMAYDFSEDPRQPIGHAPSEANRSAFQDWIAAGNDWRRPPR